MRIDDPQLLQLIENSCAAVTSADGRFTQADASDELMRRLTSADLSPTQQALLDRHRSHTLVGAFSDQRNPRRRSNGSFYHPKFVLKLGRGNRVWMALAIRSDVNAWLRQSGRNASAVAATERLKQDWGLVRTRAFDQYADIRYLDELERVVFGYTDSGEDPFRLF